MNVIRYLQIMGQHAMPLQLALPDIEALHIKIVPVRIAPLRPICGTGRNVQAGKLAIWDSPPKVRKH